VFSRVLARWERCHSATPFPSVLDPLESANCGQRSKTQMVLDVQVCNAPDKRIPARSRPDAVCANAEQIELAVDAIEVKIHLVFPLRAPFKGLYKRPSKSRKLVHYRFSVRCWASTLVSIVEIVLQFRLLPRLNLGANNQIGGLGIPPESGFFPLALSLPWPSSSGGTLRRQFDAVA